jgi:hypothetical protein
MSEKPIEEFVRECYDRNFELLRLEGGGSISPEARQAGLNQVLLYWNKLRQVAESVTDAEVPIHLPNQHTPLGRMFGIEGIVDIVREDDKVIMYDVKTHDTEYVQTHKELYASQLNLYAHVWHKLRGQPLDEMYIIATGYPDAIQKLLSGKYADQLTVQEANELEQALKEWNPQVQIEFNESSVAQTINDFGEAIDKIEDGQFTAPDLDKLNAPWQTSNQLFATRVCRNCDARFSCESYRAYAEEAARSNWRMQGFVETFLQAPEDETTQEGWISSSLSASPEDLYIDALLGE